MARFHELTVGELASGWVLAPERYGAPEEGEGAALGELVTLTAELVEPALGATLVARVLDTGDAQEGFVRAVAVARPPGFRSTKKRLRAGDVIVSRLRPYLRQVAYVDEALFVDEAGAPVEVVASSEFYVLRSSGSSLQFLLPWLLSEAVQRRLSAAQEGGHHPRVPRQRLLELRVPAAVLARRETLSREVSAAVASYRQAERAMRALCGSLPGEGASGQTPM